MIVPEFFMVIRMSMKKYFCTLSLSSTVYFHFNVCADFLNLIHSDSLCLRTGLQSMSSEMLFINHIVWFVVTFDVPECQTFVSQGQFMITYTS